MLKDNAYLADILNAAKAIERFLAGISLEAFKANEEKYEAVNRKLHLEKYLAANPPPES